MKENKERLIEFATVNLAKSKGFDWLTLECFTEEGEEQFSSGDEGDYQMYNHNQWDGLYSRPTQALLAKWLREKHKFHIEIYLGHDEDSIWYNYHIFPLEKSYNYEPVNDFVDGFDTFEQAYEEALLVALNKI